MIKSFGNKTTQKLFERERLRNFPPLMLQRMLKKLLLLNSATRIEELRVPPGNRLKQLEGAQANRYSIRVNDQWRLCFTWNDGDAENVEILDYH